MQSAAEELANGILQSNSWKKRLMADPNLPLLEDAVRKLAPFLDEIVFVGGVTLGLLITDEAAAPIRGTTDVDVIAEIVTLRRLHCVFRTSSPGSLHRRHRPHLPLGRPRL